MDDTSRLEMDSPPLTAGEEFTMIDDTNGFNKLSQMAILWTMHNLWLKGSRFSFSFYQHKAMLILPNTGNLLLILWSFKGVTQGDSMAMVLYGEVLIPLVKIC